MASLPGDARGSGWRYLGSSRATWINISDGLAIAAVAVLPWSTSLLGIFLALWALSLLPTFERVAFLSVLKHPASILPVALFALSAAGMLWADADWVTRLGSADPLAKLLFIPLFMFHFARSQRGAAVLGAFLISCALLMTYSWIIYADPRLAWAAPHSPGIPVKDYIDQSQELALAAFVALGLAWRLRGTGKWMYAAGLALLAAGFVVNILVVAVARTALIYLPVLLMMFALCHLSRRGLVLAVVGAVMVGALAWNVSSNLRGRTLNVATEYQEYRDANAITSTGRRLEYWRKSIAFIAEAPWIGHGTGATHGLFERAAQGQTGAAAEVVSNPHNQTFRIGIELGVVGIALLYAMWVAHLRLFRGSGMVAWVGTIVVVQNIVSSIFNSHLQDFHEGWMYVLGVGIAGGLLTQRRSESVLAGHAE
jgi:O-antigen ligase